MRIKDEHSFALFHTLSFFLTLQSTCLQVGTTTAHAFRIVKLIAAGYLEWWKSKSPLNPDSTVPLRVLERITLQRIYCLPNLNTKKLPLCTVANLIVQTIRGLLISLTNFSHLLCVKSYKRALGKYHVSDTPPLVAFSLVFWSVVCLSNLEDDLTCS